jgi:aryl-alcohol dehydrogenase-like predicted oxidoreductase
MELMRGKQLGTTGLYLSPIGIGAWAIGGPGWDWSWGPQEDTDSIAAIHEALDRGINWIDTAPVYGLGHSEEVVGRALRGRRDWPYVFTKCSLVWDEAGKISHDLTSASIRREAEASLKRLSADRIDLYQIHWPAWRGAHEWASPGSIEEAVEAMAHLQREGKLRHIGVSNFSVAQIQRARAIADVVSVQSPYSLLARDIEYAILPYARRNHIGVLAYSPMYSGLLSGAMTRDRIARLGEGDWRRNDPNFREPLLSRNLQLVDMLRMVSSCRHATPGEVAIAWTLHHPAVTASIVGVRSPAQVRDIVGAVDLHLSYQEMEEIEHPLPQWIA